MFILGSSFQATHISNIGYLAILAKNRKEVCFELGKSFASTLAAS
jgi:hypothetical protein